MKYLLYFSLALGIVGVGLVFSNEVMSLEQEIGQLEAHIEELEEKMEVQEVKHEEQLNELEKELEEFESDVRELESKRDQLKKKIEGLEQLNLELREELNKFQSLTFEATAYTAFCSTGCIGITRTGIDVSDRTHINGRRIVAVDPRVIPLGTELVIDTGGAIKGHKIDILMSSKEKAREFGRRNVTVYFKTG